CIPIHGIDFRTFRRKVIEQDAVHDGLVKNFGIHKFLPVVIERSTPYTGNVDGERTVGESRLMYGRKGRRSHNARKISNRPAPRFGLIADEYAVDVLRRQPATIT